MSNILNVVVKDVEPEVVPGDDSADEATTPDTGRFTTTVLQQSNTNNPISFTPAIFVGGSIVFLAIFLALRFRSKKTFGFNKNKLSLAPKFACILSLLCLTFGLVGLLVNTHSSKAATGDLDITPSGDTITIERVKGEPAYAAAKAEVTMNESAIGYDLFVYAPEGNELTSEGQESSITPVAEPESKLTANTWGVTAYTTEDITTDSAIWNPVSEAADEPTLVATADDTIAGGDKISFYYGIYIDKDLPAGTYTTSIEYQAKPHYYAVTFDANGGNIVDEDTETTTTMIIPGDELSTLPDVERENHNFLGWFTEAEGGEQITADTIPTSSTTYYAHWEQEKTISDLTYMQDFKTLSTAEKTSVLDSMALNTQYQLKDSRDQKDYWIAKLADGNVWMTQNLDHDIVTDTNYYTTANTDIPANWTPAKATYATDDTTWNNSSSSPESYDPGELCWNGAFTTDYQDAKLDNYARECTEDDLINHHQIGNYYNWTAAVAMNNSDQYTSYGVNANQSICPAGWGLPTIASDMSYQNLIDSIPDLSAGINGNIQYSPAYFVYSGFWGGYSGYGSSNFVGDYGTYLTSVTGDSSSPYALSLYADWNGTTLNAQNTTGRSNGFSVRCMVRTSAQGDRTISGITYMQDFKNLSNEDKATVLDSMIENTQYQLEDNRDGKVYYVAKLADGNVWMTQNLDHDIVTTTNFYTPENTDIPATMTASTTTRAPSSTTWNMTNFFVPDSYNPGNLCWKGIISTSGTNNFSTNARGCLEEDLSNHRQIGNYYNWTAAVMMNDSSQYAADGTDVGQSVCPAGWRLPTKTGNKSYQNLVNNIPNLSAGVGGDIQNNPTYFVYGGELNDNGTSNGQVGASGNYWSSVASGDDAYHFSFLSSADGVWTQSSHYRSLGYSVRCVAR